MAINPPLGGGIPPDLYQKNPIITMHNHQLVSSQNSKRHDAYLQMGEGFTVAPNRLKTSNDAQNNAGKIPSTHGNRVSSSLQTLPPNNALEISTMGIESSIHFQIGRKHKADGEDEEGIQSDLNQWEITSAYLKNISEQENQHFIHPISITIKTTLPSNPSTKYAQQNVSTRSTTPIVIKLDGKDSM